MSTLRSATVDTQWNAWETSIYLVFVGGLPLLLLWLPPLFHDNPLIWLTKPVAIAIVIGFLLALTGSILRIRNIVSASRVIRVISVVVNFSIPLIVIGTLLGTLHMTAVDSFYDFSLEYGNILWPSCLPFAFAGFTALDLWVPRPEVASLTPHKPTL
ncbi:hypothetical protein [Actinomyces sp.]